MPTAGITAKRLIRLALRQAGVVGIGQAVRAEDEQDLFDNLNFMIAGWQRDRFLVWQTVDVAVQSSGKASYTIGPGMDFNVARPSRVEQAFSRQNPGSTSPLDYPLDVLFSREDYDRVRLKSIASWPRCVYYDRSFPVGNLFFWPVPNSTFELHLTLMQQLQRFDDPAQEITMPEEYQDVILQNLTIRARSMWSLPPDPVVIALAKKAMNTLRASNAEIPALTIAGVGWSPNIYDPYGAGAV